MNTPTCSIDNCDSEIEKDHAECILHCEKSDYGTDWEKGGFLSRFYNALVKTIAIQLVDRQGPGRALDEEELTGLLLEESPDLPEETKKKLSAATIVFTNVFFPGRDGRDPFDYERLLKKLGAIHFNYCSFSVKTLSLEEVKCFFQDCEFADTWYLPNLQILGNNSGVLYQSCKFSGEVNGFGEGAEKLNLKEDQFADCQFRNGLSLHGVSLGGKLFKNQENLKGAVAKLSMQDCRVSGKFIANNLEVGDLNLEDVEFLEKAELKRSVISKLSVKNCNFSRIFDAHECKVIRFLAERCIFKDFVGFEESRFGESKMANSQDGIAHFEYVTFLEFVNFRKATFYNGLDLENTNFRSPPNFLKASIAPAGTNRESFRIVKNSFDRVGNQIEGNNYFAEEMRTYRRELKGSPWTQERFMLLLNEKISNFGQSYLRPILWILVAGLVYMALTKGYESNLLYRIAPPANAVLEAMAHGANSFARAILPFQKLLKEGMEFVSLLFYAVFSSLIWQTIVAVKRQTKR